MDNKLILNMMEEQARAYAEGRLTEFTPEAQEVADILSGATLGCQREAVRKLFSILLEQPIPTFKGAPLAEPITGVVVRNGGNSNWLGTGGLAITAGFFDKTTQYIALVSTSAAFNYWESGPHWPLAKPEEVDTFFKKIRERNISAFLKEYRNQVRAHLYRYVGE